MRMHLKWNLAKKYLESEGHPMGESSWYRWKQRLAKETQQRLYEIAQYEFPQQHLEAIEEIRIARKIMWENVHKVTDPVKQNDMIQNIINTLPLRSSYYDATKEVIQKPEPKEDNTIQESDQQPQSTDEWV